MHYLLNASSRFIPYEPAHVLEPGIMLRKADSKGIYHYYQAFPIGEDDRYKICPAFPERDHSSMGFFFSKAGIASRGFQIIFR